MKKIFAHLKKNKENYIALIAWSIIILIGYFLWIFIGEPAISWLKTKMWAPFAVLIVVIPSVLFVSWAID